MSKWHNLQVKRAVKIHADASTHDNRLEFRLTPAQARLAYWGMRCLSKAICESVYACRPGADYADDLRCHADADEWARDFMGRLQVHAESDGKSMVQEGVACV